MSEHTSTDRPSPFSSEDWLDPLEERVRQSIRGFIEQLVESELEAFLSRPRYGRGGPVAAHRHGHRERQLLGTFGPTTVSLPRARVQGPEGRTREWRSQALRAYKRLTKRAEALIAGVYLAGTNTRRVRRALQGLFGGAVGKDTVIRAWHRVQSEWQAWQKRDLAGDPIVRLILDGTVVKVRIDRQATALSILVAMGVRQDGQKVVLAIRSMGGESQAAWRAVLDDLVRRGMTPPELMIVDGAPGLEAALAALWPEIPVQRCSVHTIRIQSPVRFDWGDAARRRIAERNDMTDLQAVGVDDDPVDDELQDGLLISKGGGLEPAPDAVAEGRQVDHQLLGLGALRAEALPLGQLALEGPVLLGQLAAPLGQLGQSDGLGLIGIDQSPIRAVEAIEMGPQRLIGSLLPAGGAVGGAGELLELGEQLSGVGKQAAEMLPYHLLQILGVDLGPWAGCRACGEDAVLAGTAIIAPLAMGGGGRPDDAMHR